MKLPYFTYQLSVIILLLLILTGFDTLNDIKYPQRKINKQISKEFNVEDFELKLVTGSDVNASLKIFTINIDKGKIGNLIVNRVFSCRENGCSVNLDPLQDETYEYFDYFMILDSTGAVLLTNIYNYQATKGHEVMSRGWLKQFVGYRGTNDLNYGQEIDAISGATISASAFVEEVKYVTKALSDSK